MDKIKLYTKEYWAGYYDACKLLSTSPRMNKAQLEVIEEQGYKAKERLETLGVKFSEQETDEAPKAKTIKTQGSGFHPLGGASRGVGRCICAAGPGTNPACPVHP